MRWLCFHFVHALFGATTCAKQYLDSDVGWGFGRDVPQDVQGLVVISSLNGQLAVGDHYLDLVGPALV